MKRKNLDKFLNNIFYMISNTWKFDRKSLIFYLLKVPTMIILPLLTSFLFKIMIDSITVGTTALVLLEQIISIGLLIALLTAINPILEHKYQASSENLCARYRVGLLNHMMKINYSILQSAEGRQKFEKTKPFVLGGQFVFLSSFINIIMGILGGITYLAVLSLINPYLIIILSIFGCLYLILNKSIYNIEGETDDVLASLDIKNDYIFRTSNDYQVGKDIRIFEQEKLLENKSQELKKSYLLMWKTLTKKTTLIKILQHLITFFAELTVFIFLIAAFFKDNMALSDFIFLFGLASGFWIWIVQTSNNSLTLQRLVLLCQYYRDFIENYTIDNCCDKLIKCNEYTLSFDNVSFSYANTKVETLSNINFMIKQGEKIAVVGENGSGKTTLMNLICGLLDATTGTIYINNQNINGINKAELFTLYSALFQDNIILPISIAENIALANKEDINQQKLDDVVEKTGLKEVVNALEFGLETKLIKKVNEIAIDFSGGEIQKLLLARALYKDAPILILDEPTAALDPIAEKNLYYNYKELFLHKTTFYVSHRLASTKFCDRIFYISKGQITEIGTHDELMKLKGSYAKMYNIQSCYYKKGNNFDEKE